MTLSNVLSVQNRLQCFPRRHVHDPPMTLPATPPRLPSPKSGGRYPPTPQDWRLCPHQYYNTITQLFFWFF